ncbi:WxL domain-containing protein [Lacticaseibacillus saniviri]
MRKGIYFATLLSLSAITLITVSPQLVGADDLNPNPLPISGPGTTATNISTATTIGEGFASKENAPASANSTAEFTVTPGALTLDRVPDFNFGDIGTSQLVKKSLKTSNLDFSSNNAKTGGTSKGKTAFDGNSAGELQLTDYRGTNAGWVVYGQISPFTVVEPTSPAKDGTTSTKTSMLTGKLTLNSMTPAEADYDGDSAIATQKVDLETGAKSDQLGTAAAVWQAALDTGQGLNKVKFGAGAATLTLTRNAHTESKTYQATMRWTLANAPTAKAPGTGSETPAG